MPCGLFRLIKMITTISKYRCCCLHHLITTTVPVLSSPPFVLPHSNSSTMTTTLSNISTSPSSADIVDDIEKRITTEIEQLQRDIQRIEPAGADWCTFGDLFIDTDVQQYYEALVNTLKSAKRKGVVYFKGQFLLKGMHDDVIVQIVKDDKNQEASEKEISSPETDSKSKFKGRHDGKAKESQHKSFDSHANGVKKDLSDTKTFIKKKSYPINHSFPNYHNYNRSPTNQSTLYKSSSFAKNKNGSNSSLQLIKEQDQHEQVHSTPRSTATSPQSFDDDELLSPSMYSTQSKFGGRNDKPVLSTEKIKITKSSPKSKSSPNESMHSNSSAVEITGTKLSTFLFDGQSSSGRQSEGGDSESVVSFATAPVFSMNKSPNALNISRAQNRDIVHFPVAGTTFNSGNNAESHAERLDRECQQLVKDIWRIEPENEAFCKFGMLFDDPQVEQYYEALVGTLKAARRKGIINFKGQILLKGMHDNVQISIVD